MQLFGQTGKRNDLKTFLVDCHITIRTMEFLLTPEEMHITFLQYYRFIERITMSKKHTNKHATTG
jgi:hypothetical protein